MFESSYFTIFKEFIKFSIIIFTTIQQHKGCIGRRRFSFGIRQQIWENNKEDFSRKIESFLQTFGHVRQTI